jgi:peptide deformylase
MAVAVLTPPHLCPYRKRPRAIELTRTDVTIMASLPILIAPDPRLKRPAVPVERVDGEIRRLMDDMLESMYGANGIGLAAPQVGVLKRVIVVDISAPDEPNEPMRLANPEVLWHSDDAVLGEEGCLSLPEQYADVKRPSRIRVRYLDHENEIRELEADGLLAKCIQHEIDHLDGVLFVDHISAVKRNIILRKLGKAKKHGAFAAA